MTDPAMSFGEKTVEPKPASTLTLHADLVRKIRELVIEGDLEPGAKVPERILCERFGVSRTPLREALKTLASESLLELLPRRGARVAQLSEDDVNQMFPIMGALEALSGELACANLTAEKFAEIQALHYQMVLHHTRRELAPYFKVNQAIHEKILEAAANPLLLQMYQTLAGRIRRARYIANMSDERWSQAIAEHEEILTALSKRDAHGLADVLRRHLQNKCETVKTYLRAEVPQI
jgi:DNA-binding GntR family transcriptional regulator